MTEQLTLNFSNPTPQPDPAPFFTADDLIHVYTRAEALADGFLVDVSETAREAGFRWPVALTTGLWGLIEDIPESQRHQNVNGRLWDVLWMAYCAIKVAKKPDTLLFYKLIMHHVVGGKMHKYVTLKLVTGPGDHGEPVVTIMLPDED